jgi:hypothetical protein
MSTNYKEIARSIEDFDTAATSLYNGGAAFRVTMDTVFSNSELTIMRNKLIRLLHNSFITANGYVNVSALLVFCYTYNFKYSTTSVLMMKAPSFVIMYANLSIEVTA